VHILKSYKSSINLIILKLSYKDKAAFLLYYLYLYRIFNYFLIKLYIFQIESKGKNFNILSLSLKIAGF
jgi:hypothetical protein